MPQVEDSAELKDVELGAPEAKNALRSVEKEEVQSVEKEEVPSVEKEEVRPRTATQREDHETDRGFLDWRWGYRESWELLLEILPCTRLLSYEAQRDHVTVKYNPFFWAALVMTIPCVVTGRWVHTLVGQGSPIPGELECEHKARVAWVYCMDGPYTGTALLTFLEMIDAAAPSTFGGGSSAKLAEAYVLDLCITLGYVAGNVAFLSALRSRDVGAVRTGVVANASFALALTVLLTICIVRSDPFSWSWNQKSKFTMRFGCVGFFVFAAMTYKELWSARAGSSQGPLTPKLIMVRGTLCFGAVSVWVAFVAVLASGDPKVVWDALA